MNSLELKTTLDVFGISEISDKTRKGRYGTDETVYNWNGITIAFGGSYYSVIGGQVPYTVAKIMSKKYPNHRDDVRIDGTYGYGKVGDKKYYDKDELGNAYIDCYHIDSKEGLIYLLSEMQYYRATGGIYTEELRKAHYRKQRAIIAEVNKRLIEYGNPYKTTEEWLKEHNMVETSNNDDALEILPYVTEFDNTVNPFQNPDFEMKQPEDYMDKVSFGLYANASDDVLRMQISNGSGHVEHARSIDRDGHYLTHGSYYRVGPNTSAHIHHYISPKDNANVICISTYHDDYSQEDKIDLRYDLISGLAYRTYAKDDEKKPITPEQKVLLIQELEKATNEARKVTLKNMATTVVANTLVKHR